MSVIPINQASQNQPLQMSSMQTKTQYRQAVADCSKGCLSKEHMAWLWIKMSQIYGQLFISKFGVKDDGTWFETLKDLTPLALESGMERLRQLTESAKFATFPPICLEFRAVCLGFYDDLKLPKAIEAYREIKNRAL